MIAAAVVALSVLLSGPATPPQDAYAELARRFDYDRRASLDVRQAGVTRRRGATVYDLSYASPRGGRVPAYLVVPAGRGPFAAVLFGHWGMKGSPVRGRKEFLEEAVVLARAGVVSLLIDAPFARPGYRESTEPFDPRDVEDFYQQVLDLRRGVDLLVARKDVDPRRIAYVGHSYGANVGGVLAGVEKRIKTFVLMAGNLADAEALLSDEPGMVKLRESVGEEKIKRIVAETSWLDPAHHLGQAAPSSVLLQFGRRDSISEARARRFLELVGGPKELKLYDAGHALDAAARRDRYEWLRRRLGLRPLDPGALERVPEVK